MSRFQALTTPVLDQELDYLREEMGLRESQKAELLRELASMSAWLVRQARAGRRIEATGPDGAEVFHHPAFDAAAPPARLVLSDADVARLAEILSGPPSPALLATLRRIADPERRPPSITWKSRAS